MRMEIPSVRFEELMALRESVFRICLGFCRNASDAEDLTQDVYLKAFRNLKGLKDPDLKKPWLYRIARNACLDHHRSLAARRGRELSAADNGIARENPEAETERDEQVGRLKEAVNSLPKRLKEIFVLREYGHLSYEEIARTAGVRRGTVMSRLSRARRAVLARFEELEHGRR
jgi:RNA polymerase sigma-70 factor (ECF subfamily)